MSQTTTKEAKGIKIDGKDVVIPKAELLKKVVMETIQYFSKPGKNFSLSLSLRVRRTNAKRKQNNNYIK
jgi:hypothetical protein